MSWSGDSVVYVPSRDTDHPATYSPLRRRIAHGDVELVAQLVTAEAKGEGASSTGAIDHLPAGIEVVQLTRPKGDRCMLVLVPSDETRQMGFGHE